MERIKQYVHTEESVTPYVHRSGTGKTIGCGDRNGCGECFVNYRPIINYNGSGIISYNNKPVSFIDDFAVCVTHIKEPYALGEVIKNDLTTQKCCLGKVNNHIVVAQSIRDVITEMRYAIKSSNDIEADIAQAFVIAHPVYEKQYNWSEMVEWHSLIPSSCLEGRQQFKILSNRSNPNDMGTPKELIGYMKCTPSFNVAKKIEEIYLKQKR